MKNIMNKIKGLTVNLFVSSTLLLLSCSDNLLDNDLRSKRSLVKDQGLFLVVDTTSDSELKEALKFLYAYMPLGDISDYDASLYLDAAKVAISTKESTEWGPSIPEEIFRHFVLPLRVNNESLDSSRVVINRELMPRLKGLSMEEAILEVNHWCHEYVVYSPSDERTSSPLATMRNGEGRCGEESVFTVAALRAVGIPARQVYTPRWAHTDDNHAWVEAWANGKWHYIGACEPEPVLDMAWFTSSATRAVLMHTKVFGRYSGPEEVIEQTGAYTEINVTSNYAPVSKISLTVKDVGGELVQDATVEFCIYNYAEFWPAIRLKSDSKGVVNVSLGKGDVLARVFKGDKFGFAVISPRDESFTTEIVLNKGLGDDFTAELDIVPPVEGVVNRVVTEKQIEENKDLLLKEDSIRVARLKMSEGNKPEIEKFKMAVPESKRFIGETILESMSAKDLKDTPSEVLIDHLANIEDSITETYIISPRIGRELLSPWRGFFKNIPGADTLLGNPLAIEKLCATVRIENRYNPQAIPVSPAGVWKLGVADSYSRDLLFVALCRTFGTPARLNPVTSVPEYFFDGVWQKARFTSADEVSESSDIAKGSLSLDYNGGVVDDPRFESHFTISRIDESGFNVLSFRNREGFEGTSSWKSVFGEGSGVQLDPGYYVLTSGTRMADGKILTRMQFFNVKGGERSSVNLILREDSEDLRVIGNMNVDASIIEKCGRGYFILVFLKHNHEPGNHILSDIVKYKEDFREWGRALLFVYPDLHSLSMANERVSEMALPDNFIFIADKNSNLINAALTGIGIKDDAPSPLIIVADTFGRVVFSSGGYSIGTGERLIKITKKL